MDNGFELLDKLQEASFVNERKVDSKPQYKFDKLKMYFGEDFNYKGITISMPTIGDILDIGEEKFYQSLSPFIYNSTSIRVLLWDNGIDWNKIKDIEVFHIMSSLLREEKIEENKMNADKKFFSFFKKTKEPYQENVFKKTVQNIMFKNVNFCDFNLLSLNEKNSDDKNKNLALYNREKDILLYEEDYMVIAEYIREMLNMHPKVEKAKGKTTKSWMIQEDKMNIQNNGSKNTSTLLPLISTCINHSGFKYKLQELREVGIYQFMDSVKRIQKYENGIAALHGCYSGFVDSSKLDKEILNYMGDI